MCAPCKIIINEEGEGSSCIATLLAQMIINPPREMEPGSPADDALYEMAAAEVASVLATRDRVRKHLHGLGVPQRWMDLIDKLYGGA